MIDALANLVAVVLIAMIGGWGLQAQFDFDFWPATAGCFYLLILSRGSRS